jgi:hypothetical protein
MITTSALANSRCVANLEALRAEFGAALTARILDDEAADFLWDSRLKERYLGQHFDVGLGCGEDEMELSRIAILSFLDGSWHVGSCLVDGDGRPADMLWKRRFGEREEAEAAFDRAA